jgi:hypothetical protein
MMDGNAKAKSVPFNASQQTHGKSESKRQTSILDFFKNPETKSIHAPPVVIAASLVTAPSSSPSTTGTLLAPLSKISIQTSSSSRAFYEDDASLSSPCKKIRNSPCPSLKNPNASTSFSSNIGISHSNDSLDPWNGITQGPTFSLCQSIENINNHSLSTKCNRDVGEEEEEKDDDQIVFQRKSSRSVFYQMQSDEEEKDAPSLNLFDEICQSLPQPKQNVQSLFSPFSQ